jgi:D-serine deaminase-like pyridoxal phosphate-dependent protein
VITRTTPRVLGELLTPAAIVDLDCMAANLDRMAAYTAASNLALRPHTKTHKTPEFAAEQIKRGAIGLTVATLREAEVMSTVSDDLLLAYPPVGPQKLARLFELPEHVRMTVGLDSAEALDGLSAHARIHGRKIGVLVEIDAGMHRVGTADPTLAADLARRIVDDPNLEWRGLMFYPGHIREPVDQQGTALQALEKTLDRFAEALERAGLRPDIVSGGSTPAAFQSHQVTRLTEIRPGTYIFNDRTTVAVGACEFADCAYTVLATIVSTAVPGQAVVDAGSKALSREDIRGADAPGFGVLLDRPDVTVKGMSEEHGLLDLSHTDWKPRIGERVRIVPNHVCVSVNLHDRLWGVHGDAIETSWPIQARNWSPAPMVVNSWVSTASDEVIDAS